MFLLIFVIGKPGSGKTTLIQFLSSEIEKHSHQHAQYLNDRDILLAMACGGGSPSLIKSIDDNNFIVHDDSAYDIAIQRLKSEIQAARNEQILLIEFSRRDYLKAFSMMEDLLLSSKYCIVYLNVSFEICKERNIERAKVNNYIVPEEEMETYFREDDIDKLVLKYPTNFILLDSSMGVEELGQQTVPILGFIQREFEANND